jgi:hypothetical protein
MYIFLCAGGNVGPITYFLVVMEDITKADLAWKFALGEPLVRPKQVRHLPIQMRRLHDWYMEVIKEE